MSYPGNTTEDKSPEKCQCDETSRPDLVRQEYKRFKKRNPPPTFNDVIDFSIPHQFQEEIATINLASPEDARNGTLLEKLHCCGLKDPCCWNIFELKACPGLLFVRDPFVEGAQRYWAKKAITTYTKKPFPSNLDIHMDLDPTKTIWEISLQKDDQDKFLEKLRWVHLGYHFDYNVVDYKQKKYYGFPEDLAELMKCIAQIIGYPTYVAETAIINYYPIGSSMGGHTDHYEEELHQPLISVSFGQPAVFLIGGPTRDIKPKAIWIRSGDIVIMSGLSRVAFHAVPCIVKEKSSDGLPGTLARTASSLQVEAELEMFWNKQIPSLNQQRILKQSKDQQLGDVSDCSNEYLVEEYNESGTDKIKNSEAAALEEHKFFDSDITLWKQFERYLSKTRININVRQVHKLPLM